MNKKPDEKKTAGAPAYVRLPDDLREMLNQAREPEHRDLSAEIVVRLYRSFEK